MSNTTTEKLIAENIAAMEKKVKAIPFATKEYWEQRCRFREKMDDPTYSDFERNNCRNFHSILVNKQP